jgi:hypothetical protein
MNFMSRLIVKFKNQTVSIHLVMYKTGGVIRMDLQINHIYLFTSRL